MSIQKSLEKYTSAVNAMEAHQKENEGVFKAHQEYLFRVIDAENELRDDVVITNKGIENRFFKATITPQSRTFADIEELDKLVEQNIITKEIREKVVKTIDRPAKITIKKQAE